MGKKKIKDICRFCSGIIPVNERKYANGRCGQCAHSELVNQMAFNAYMDLLTK